jgi:hypothetical protein
MAGDHVYRGSRKHVLDWVSSSGFALEFTHLLEPTGARVEPSGTWQPIGHRDPEEARLEVFGPRHLPDLIDWPALSHWWLAHEAGANTPNWDIAAVCTFATKSGLVLVEAKANDQELKTEGKSLDSDASANSRANHDRIGAAIREAREGLNGVVPGVRLDRDRCYQLSNRLAFAWKLASMGLPTVLVYLGFLGDEGIEDAGRHFRDRTDWETCLRAHARAVAPDALFEREIRCGPASMWALIRSRPVLEQSPKGAVHG